MERDVPLKCYLSDNARYADLVNGFGFGGRQIVKADMLSDLDTQTGIHQLPGFKKRKRKPKYRDLIRKAAFGLNFAVIGVENQDEVNYLMPLRTMVYDANEYERQIAKISKFVRKRKGISHAEFLSGFGRKDRLHPCITIVLFYGDKWDGSTDLLGLMDFTNIPPELRKLVNNYRIHLFSIKDIPDTGIFKTDLRQVFDFIRCSKEKRKLRELVENDDAYKEVDEDAYDVMVAFTHATEFAGVKKLNVKGGKVDMCQALTELLADERSEGRLEGGIEALILDNLEEGTARERIIEKLQRRFQLEEAKAKEYYERYAQKSA